MNRNVAQPGLARLTGGQKVESSNLSVPTIAFPIARQWLTHWRAVSFLLSYSNCGTCADSPVPENPMQRREKSPFRSVLRLLSRRFSPFEKTADFSPKSPFSTSNPASLHFFLNSVAWMSRENISKYSPQKNSGRS